VKSFVQQVGRVIRNPHRDRTAVAYVLDHSNGRQEDLWQNFLRYDKTLAETGVEGVALGNEELLKALGQKYPPLTYVEGRFRTPCDLNTLDQYADLQLPLTVNVVRKAKGFRLQDFLVKLTQKYREADRVVRELPPDDHNMSVIFYVSFSNSPFLREKYFLESKLGVTILWDGDEYLFYYDSLGGPLPSDVLEGPVPASNLRRLFQRSENSFLTSVSLLNADPGYSAVRSRSVSAVKIGATAPGFDDHAFVCSTAEGYTSGSVEDANEKQRRIRRYVGFGHGRVSDLAGKWVPLGRYLQWLVAIKARLESKVEPEAVFGRYASITPIPKDTTPLSILLDVSGVIERYVTTKGDAMQIDDLCVDVKNGVFSVMTNGAPCVADIRFDPTLRKYVISSKDLDQMYESNDPNNPEGLVGYLNATQSFKVIPRSQGIVYSLGDFHSPLIKFGPEYNDEKMSLFSSIFTDPILEKITQEKGTKCQSDGKGWETGCLFHLIDKLGEGTSLSPHLADADTLVCDDMGAETADFIAVVPARGDQSGRAILIHAKASEGSPHYCSASALQTVCSQAVKNLGELSLYTMENQDKIDKWGKAWKGKQGEVANRIRRGKNVENAWENIRRTVHDPSAQHEVWLVLGGILSKAHFNRLLTSSQPKPFAKQAAYLLFSTLTTVASNGRKLRIFCSP